MAFDGIESSVFGINEILKGEIPDASRGCF